MSDSEPSSFNNSLRQRIEVVLRRTEGRQAVGLNKEKLQQLSGLFVESGVSLDIFVAELRGLKVCTQLIEIWRAMMECPELREQLGQSGSRTSWLEALEGVWEFLLIEIKRLVERLDWQESLRNGGVFRELCRLACEWDVDPESFRRLLVRAGMNASRASEIKAVLESSKVCENFLDRRQPISWKQALEQARKQTQSPNKLQQVARRLVQLVLGNQGLWEKGATCGSAAAAPIGVQRTARGGFVVNHPSGDFIITLNFPGPGK